MLNWQIIKQNDNLDIKKELNLIENIFWRKFLWEEKNINLIIYLKKAQNDNWEEGIILKINSLVLEINISANKRIDNSILLKEEINNYKYKEIIYLQFLNNWIKKQIFEPIFEIKELLSKNLKKIILSEKEIKEKMLISDYKFKNILELQLIRMKLQKEKILYNINVLEKYLEKVK